MTDYHPATVAQHTPRKRAMVMADLGQATDYRQLVDQSNRLAHAFADAGLREGDTVAFLLENSCAYPELMWAAKNSGMRYVCISTHLTADDAAYIVRDSGARMLVASFGLRDLAGQAAALLDNGPALFMIGGSEPPFRDLDAIARECSAQPLQGQRRRGPSMLYSSGTTGRPKGVRTSIPDAPPHEPPQRFAMLQKQYGLGPDTVFLNPGPFYHAGPNRFMMSVLRAGGTVIGLSRFSPEATLRAIEEHGVTHGFFVPTMFSRMLALPDDIRNAVDTKSLRHAIHAAAPCPVPLKQAMIDWWGPVIDELYAGTEAFGHTFITSAEWLDHVGSVGRPAKGCRLKIVDEDGRTLPQGQAGRIMMTNGLKIAYHGDAAKSAALYDEDGYASLGDIGYLDEDGYLYLTDRESHMIIVGGVNVYPQEIENALLRHPAVEDAAVIGVPDEDLGERIKAVIQLHPHVTRDAAVADEIMEFCRHNLSAYNRPHSIDFGDSLPRSPMGKLLKKQLRERYWSGLDRMI
ncbi:AMP-binding protein [Aurantiacibacter rhizosphaerae]|uniref:AMP-binding protein n=1 Tax=Aurantiacibacter rhizosphaerae TaxID=2691582 RepID=A0A844XFL9_9SPHN|nr:AMP-binding protein [Aurantiacibacter rhizosphaerae]MWV29277.1 AMP-binding protein [Aurantiacibacter rhizosphaerae]